MKNIIKDYRIKETYTFSMHDGNIESENVARLLSTKALYCYINKDFNLVKMKSDELDETKIDLHIDDFKTSGSFKTKSTDVNEFEQHYIANVSAEKIFRNFFFSEISAQHEEYLYFIFQPFIIELEKNTNYFYQIYPVIKIINNEFVVVEFDYFPNDEEIKVDDFADTIIRSSDEIKDLKFPQSYFDALNIVVKEDTAEKYLFENNESLIFSSEDVYSKNFIELSMFFVSLLFSYKENVWFGRTVISLDNRELTKDEIYLIKNGFSYEQINPLYDDELIDFSEHKQTSFYVFGHMTLTLGDILESHVPATVLDEEISILNTKILTSSRLTGNETLEELLNYKKDLQYLKQQISYKYSKILLAHTVMDYAIINLFTINDKIEQIENLLETEFQKKDFEKIKRDNTLNIFIGFVSVILSMSAIFEYIIKPIYEIRFNRSMLPSDIILNYLLLLGSSMVIIGLVIWRMNKEQNEE